MNIKTIALGAAFLLPTLSANALIIQVDVDNVDITLDGQTMTATDSLSQAQLWDFNQDTFVFNGYDDSSYTLLETENTSDVTVNGLSVNYTLTDSSNIIIGTGSVDYGTVGSVDFGSVISVDYGTVGPIDFVITEPNTLGSTDQVGVVFTSVPEPGALGLMMAGLLGLVGFRRRQR